MRKSEPHQTTGPNPRLPAQGPAARLVLLHKPCMVLCQFSAHEGKRTLSDVFAASGSAACKQKSGLYPAGRLDFDSEGLLLLTDHGPWQARVADPRHKLEKTYWAQVEGVITDDALRQLRNGVMLNDGAARAVRVRALAGEPELPPREPPIRVRREIPTAWLEIVLDEGRNRQVRRMTAAVGLPTLRLVRVGIGPWRLADLAPGEAREVALNEVMDVLGAPVFRAASERPPRHRSPSPRPTRPDRDATRASRTAPESSARPSATTPPRKPRDGGRSPR